MANGNPFPGIAIWLINGKKLLYNIIKVASDGTFNYQVSKNITQNFAGGQCFVIVQHPMGNNKFDIYPDSKLQNVLATLKDSEEMRILSLENNLGKEWSANIALSIMQALNHPNVDDAYTKLQFFIE